jgi:hypothetical protein
MALQDDSECLFEGSPRPNISGKPCPFHPSQFTSDGRATCPSLIPTTRNSWTLGVTAGRALQEGEPPESKVDRPLKIPDTEGFVVKSTKTTNNFAARRFAEDLYYQLEGKARRGEPSPNGATRAPSGSVFG